MQWGVLRIGGGDIHAIFARYRWDAIGMLIRGQVWIAKWNICRDDNNLRLRPIRQLFFQSFGKRIRVIGQRTVKDNGALCVLCFGVEFEPVRNDICTLFVAHRQKGVFICEYIQLWPRRLHLMMRAKQHQ